MNHSKSAKHKFNIEDCSESEQEETQRKSLNAQSQSLFQTTLFGALDSQVKQFKKKPIVKKSMTEFLNNYDQNFDDVFGSMKMPIDVNQDKQVRNNNNNNNGQKSNKKQQQKRPIETVNSESDSNSEIQTTTKKQSKPNRNGKKKQSKRIVESDSEDNKEQNENKITKKSQPKKQTKVNNKQSSEEQSSENKKYNPNSLDLPQNSKQDKKGQKLKTAIFNFGTEEFEKQGTSNKKNKKDTSKKQIYKTRSKKQVEQDDDSKDDKIEQLIKEYQKEEQELQKNLTNKKDKTIKENGSTEKIENKEKNINLNSIKKQSLNSEFSPQTKSDDEDDIDDS
ncbi:unnamed protein product [Paramecium primaurelia]|uniref:Uncharacterized protein n=1 Tax=Paramecium primaurelia TaxID=5886 RepID=A0A8S1NCU4_PARPR|nr:unnamed protein product [Paramecium primaurelia]